MRAVARPSSEPRRRAVAADVAGAELRRVSPIPRRVAFYEGIALRFSRDVDIVPNVEGGSRTCFVRDPIRIAPN